jgi:Ca2+-binding EF-hand superfamily protein
MQDLRQLFIMIDTNNDGKINMDELHNAVSAVVKNVQLDDMR